MKIPRSPQARGLDKRRRLVDTAARLTYEHGFKQTSIADIARESGVPLGNVYFYFKSKDALGEALIEKLSCDFATLRARWDKQADPRQRLEAFVQLTSENRDALARSGCPIGTLCTELHKDGGPLADRAAAILGDSLAWMEAQFRELGKRKESRDLAVQLLSALEGASLLAHAFHDPSYALRESDRLKRWVRSL